MQNLYNLVDRSSEDVLNHCEAEAMCFIPCYPLASGDLAKPGWILDGVQISNNAQPDRACLPSEAIPECLAKGCLGFHTTGYAFDGRDG